MTIATGRRVTRREAQVFVVATSLVSLQLAIAGLADLLAGTPASGIAKLCLAALAPASWRIFAGAGRPLAVLASGGIGLAALGVGLAVYGFHAGLAGPAWIDLTGLLSALAGLALVILAFRVALAGRRRMVQALLGIPAVFALAQWGIVPIVGAGLATNAGHPSIPSASTLGSPGARDVRFEADDGTKLAGWYVPGRTGAAVVLLHGAHNTRLDIVDHLRMLVAAGFAVLALDARGHGESEGATNALGWRGASDVAGAVGFLRRQPRVDAGRIAAFGLSMGGEEALRAASSGVPLAAVVADGAGGSTLADQRLTARGLGVPIAISVGWLTMRATELLSGDDEPSALKDIVDRIQVPVLLISSKATDERSIDEAFRARIGSHARHWHLPDTAHTRGLATHPDEYPRRTTGFLATALSSVQGR